MNILVVYAYKEYPFRATNWEHLRSFENYSGCRVSYLNLAEKGVPKYVRTVRFDLVIFHTLFLSQHWRGPEHFRGLLRRARPLRDLSAIKVMVPQDEFLHSELYCEFIREFGISVVFSVAPESVWDRVYPSVDRSRTRFYRVLPGYIDDAKLPLLEDYGKAAVGRPIDIGYRTAGKPYPWFGRHGWLKQRVADEVLDAAKNRSLAIDISTSSADTIHGDGWYKFLASCRYTIGSEGGTSMIDPDGSIRVKVDRFLREHPDAEFETVERACFPGVDGSCMLVAVSPRHLEACATRTCQILVEGEYNGVLVAGRHYIPVKPDFSNLGEVLDGLSDDRRRLAIVENAHRDIIRSGRFTNSAFVRFILQHSLPDDELPGAESASPWDWGVHRWMNLAERGEWARIRLHTTLKLLRNKAKGR